MILSRDVKIFFSDGDMIHEHGHDTVPDEALVQFGGPQPGRFCQPAVDGDERGLIAKAGAKIIRGANFSAQREIAPAGKKNAAARAGRDVILRGTARETGG